MVHVECPWCAGSAVVDLAGEATVHCEACDVRVEIAADATSEPLRKAA